MSRIELRQFAGELPALNSSKLPERNAQIARNVKLWSGSLKPLRGLQSLQYTQYQDPETIYKYDESRWIEFQQYHTLARSAASNDQYDRLYFVGPSTTGLRVSDATMVGYTPPYPNSSVQVGVPPPDTAPTINVTGSGAGLSETRFYVYTAVNSWGEEGPPSPVSDSVTVQEGQTANVTITTVSPGVYNTISKYYIYRTNNAGTSYQYVGETATTSFSDPVYMLTAGQEELPSAEWDPPPTDIEGIIVLPNGIMAGYRRNEILFSEPGLPHAWPVRYRVPLDYTVITMGLVENGLCVLTDGQPYLVLGSHPGAMSAVRLPVPYSCEAPRAAVQIGTAMVYPSNRGLIIIDSTGARVISDLIFDDDDWRAFILSTFRAYHWRGLYICLYERTDQSRPGFLFNPNEPASGIVTFEGIPATAGYEDLATGQLFLSLNDQIQEWDAGSDLTIVYRSKPFDQIRPTVMSVVQVQAEQYPVLVAVYRDGELQDRIRVGENAPRRIAGAQLGRRYSVEITSQNEVREVIVAGNMKELV